MEHPSRSGLIWKKGQLDRPTPTWSRDVMVEAIEQVCREKLDIAKDASCAVTFYASGAFNQLHLVDVPSHATHPKSLMRVGLPVEPHYKTRGEVATLRWVRHNTTIPVPQVICFDDTNENAIGFEYILMELMPGTTAYKLWRRLNMEQKTALAKQMAEYQHQLLEASLRTNMRGIGTLMPPDEVDPVPAPGRLVDMHFFWNDNAFYPRTSAAFQSAHNWLHTHLDLTIWSNNLIFEGSDKDDDDIEEAETNFEVAKKLSDLCPKIFPTIQVLPERTCLRHDDLNLKNILVDDQGNITAIVDWESLTCQPLWASTQYPKFFVKQPREEEPLRDGYADADPDEPSPSAEDALDDEGKNGLFWIHLMEWELTQLRKVYDARMEALRPGWKIECDDALIKVDFLRAAVHCADGFWFVWLVGLWADAVEAGVAGRYPPLMEVLNSRGASLQVEASDDEDDSDDESDDESVDEDDLEEEESDDEVDGSAADEGDSAGEDAESGEGSASSDEARSDHAGGEVSL